MEHPHDELFSHEEEWSHVACRKRIQEIIQFRKISQDHESHAIPPKRHLKIVKAGLSLGNHKGTSKKGVGISCNAVGEYGHNTL